MTGALSHAGTKDSVLGRTDEAFAAVRARFGDS
jgi:hypothetical protein